MVHAGPEHFLSGMARVRESAGPADVSRGTFPFVTISREAGAGGHSLARALLERFSREGSDPLFQGWQLLDAEMCRKILQNDDLSVGLESLIAEEYHTQLQEAIYELLGGRASQSRVIMRTFRAIRTLATLGKVIIVGRAGACLTQGLRSGIHLRLVAPKEIRLQKLAVALNASEVRARKVMKEWDAARATLVRDSFGRRIDDPLLYDAVWNTARAGVDEIACVVTEMVRFRARTARREGAASPT